MYTTNNEQNCTFPKVVKYVSGCGNTYLTDYRGSRLPGLVSFLITAWKTRLLVVPHKYVLNLMPESDEA